MRIRVGTGLTFIDIPHEGCRDSAEYIYREIFKDQIYENEHVEILPGDRVLDVGANIGLFSLYSYLKGASKIVAMEPDPDCVVSFLKNTYVGNRCIQVLPLGAWHEKKETEFVSFTHRKGSSYIPSPDIPEVPLEKGGQCRFITINCLPIDRLKPASKGIDFLKMDIEGAEVKALMGAKNLIAKFKPKMAISVYHNSSDLKLIPDLITKIVPEYKYSIEKSPNGYHEAIAKFWIPGGDKR